MAKLPIDYHPAARHEADDAFDWYRDRSHRAAKRFQLELERAQTAIQNSPNAWSQHFYGTRRYLLRGFPFIVVYRVTERDIEVIAVAHGRRKPGYWEDRLAS
jgi:toxin ParE1/3/4